VALRHPFVDRGMDENRIETSSASSEGTIKKEPPRDPRNPEQNNEIETGSSESSVEQGIEKNNDQPHKLYL
jgi:hypothetical protein